MSSPARHRNIALSLLAGLAVLAGGGGSLAAEAPKARAVQLQAVLDCRAEVDATRRLACYDAAATSLDAAEKSGEVVVVDRDQVREARRAAFGFNFQMPSFMTAGDKPEALQRVTATIASANQDATGKWVLRMADGAVWRQIDGAHVSREPKPGATVEIRSATMGSFMMTLGYSHIRVHRDN